jgi:hydrogenase nickel incorporation protein HypB
VLSAAEGHDKLIKYPAIFQRSDALVITKLDLLPHTNFRVDEAVAGMRRLAPEARVFQVAALCGEGIAELADWLAGAERIRKAAGGGTSNP